jgi:S1-C subfamily serine protease
MHVVRKLIAAIVGIIIALPHLGYAAGLDESFLPYFVTVNGGAGIYLGNGLILSVAHVVGGGIVNKPKVTLANRNLTATVVKESPFEQLDLALLEIDETTLPVSLRLRRIPLCEGSTWPGEEIVSLTPFGPVRSHILSSASLPAATRRFSTVFRDDGKTGNSGTGVFEAQRKCLVGIVSRGISQVYSREGHDKTTRNLAKYFVPASVIAAFMPQQLRLPSESHPPIQFSFRQ